MAVSPSADVGATTLERARTGLSGTVLYAACTGADFPAHEDIPGLLAVRGAFAAPIAAVLGLEQRAVTERSIALHDPNGYEFDEVQKFVRRLLRNEPDVVEALTVDPDRVLEAHPLLLELRELAPHALYAGGVVEAFSNHARNQLLQASRRALNGLMSDFPDAWERLASSVNAQRCDKAAVILEAREQSDLHAVLEVLDRSLSRRLVASAIYIASRGVRLLGDSGPDETEYVRGVLAGREPATGAFVRYHELQERLLGLKEGAALRERADPTPFNDLLIRIRLAQCAGELGE